MMPAVERVMRKAKVLQILAIQRTHKKVLFAQLKSIEKFYAKFHFFFSEDGFLGGEAPKYERDRMSESYHEIFDTQMPPERVLAELQTSTDNLDAKEHSIYYSDFLFINSVNFFS